MTHFPTRSNLALLALAGLLAAGPAATAEPRAESRAAVIQSLIDCKAKSDPAERLACYDAAAGALDVAEKKGDIVVVDREQAQAARRQAFGFSMPSLDIFNRTSASPEEADRLEAVVSNAYRGGDGKWIFELEDGAVWAFYDAVDLARTPKTGSKVEIRRGGVGGYFLKPDGATGMRAKRLR